MNPQRRALADAHSGKQGDRRDQGHDEEDVRHAQKREPPAEHVVAAECGGPPCPFDPEPVKSPTMAVTPTSDSSHPRPRFPGWWTTISVPIVAQASASIARMANSSPSVSGQGSSRRYLRGTTQAPSSSPRRAAQRKRSGERSATGSPPMRSGRGAIADVRGRVVSGRGSNGPCHTRGPAPCAGRKASGHPVCGPVNQRSVPKSLRDWRSGQYAYPWLVERSSFSFEDARRWGRRQPRSSRETPRRSTGTGVGCRGRI